jgi:hypothetical protein
VPQVSTCLWKDRSRDEGITLNDRGVACYGCEGSPTSFWVYRPPSEIVPTRSVGELGRGAVRRTASDFLSAWSEDAAGRLPWLATTNGLESFEEQLPPRWRDAIRIGQVEELGAGGFEASVLLVVGDAGQPGRGRPPDHARVRLGDQPRRGADASAAHRRAELKKRLANRLSDSGAPRRDGVESWRSTGSGRTTSRTATMTLL